MEVNGVTGTIFGITDVILRNINYLNDLRANYKLADKKTFQLISQLSMLTATLNRISGCIEKSVQQQQFVEDLSVLVEGCQILILVLDKRIGQLKRNEAAHLSLVGKSHVLLAEKETNGYLANLDHQIRALRLLLTFLQW